MKNQPDKNKVCLASPTDAEFRDTTTRAAGILRKKFDGVHVPMENAIPNAQDCPNNERGLMVFTEDISATGCPHIVVFPNYGCPKTTAGCAWEAGYAFAKDKKVIVVGIRPNGGEPSITSLMIENGRYATANGLDRLGSHDWSLVPKSRSEHEQK